MRVYEGDVDGVIGIGRPCDVGLALIVGNFSVWAGRAFHASWWLSQCLWDVQLAPERVDLHSTKASAILSAMMIATLRLLVVGIAMSN